MSFKCISPAGFALSRNGGKTPLKSFVAALVLLCAASLGATGQVLMRSDKDFVRVPDCPIDAPFVPEPDRSKSTPAQDRLFYPLGGYVFKRIQFSGLSKPTDIEIVWTPENPSWPLKWHPPIAVSWPEKTTHLSVGGGNPECFVNWFFAPHNVPGHVEIRAEGPLPGLTVSFSDRPWDHEGDCPAKELCPVLVRDMRRCTAAPRSKSCDVFIDTAGRLTSPYHCRRKFDFEPVPAIWVCDEVVPSSVEGSTVLGNTMHLLKRMKSAKARQFYLSGNFRSVLDGAFAEEYMDDRHGRP
jgi:hypothetical protein